MLFDQADIFIEAAEEGDRLFHPVDADGLFKHPKTSLYLC